VDSTGCTQQCHCLCFHQISKNKEGNNYKEIKIVKGKILGTSVSTKHFLTDEDGLCREGKRKSGRAGPLSE